MAELLIRVRDRVGHNPRLNGEGHVVVVCADGWSWSKLEQQSPDWRIVKVPELAREEAETLIAEQRPHTEFYTPARRAFWLDPEQWPLDVQAWYADDSRARPSITLTRDVFLAAKSDEPLYERPNVIGEPPVIG